MVDRIESYNGFCREEELKEMVKGMTPTEKERCLEREATLYLNMVDRYSSNKRLLQKLDKLD